MSGNDNIRKQRGITKDRNKFPQERQNERTSLVSLKIIKNEPWVALNITKEQFEKMQPRTQKILKRQLSDQLNEQLIKAAKGAKTVDEVKEKLTKIMGREPMESTVFSTASELGIKEGSTLGWRRSIKKYTIIAKDAQTYEEVRLKLKNKMKKEPSWSTVLTVASKLGITEERIKKGYKKIGEKVTKQGYVNLGSKEEKVMRELYTSNNKFIKKRRELANKIADMYYNKKMSTTEINIKLKTSNTTVLNIMNLFGMPRRKKSEVAKTREKNKKKKT